MLGLDVCWVREPWWWVLFDSAACVPTQSYITRPYTARLLRLAIKQSAKKQRNVGYMYKRALGEHRKTIKMKLCYVTGSVYFIEGTSYTLWWIAWTPLSYSHIPCARNILINRYTSVWTPWSIWFWYTRQLLRELTKRAHQNRFCRIKFYLRNFAEAYVMASVIVGYLWFPWEYPFYMLFVMKID